jgi:hypothetical protein
MMCLMMYGNKRSGCLSKKQVVKIFEGFNRSAVLWIRIRIHFSRLDPDPDQHWECRRAKMTHKRAGCSLLREEDFSFIGALGLEN